MTRTFAQEVTFAYNAGLEMQAYEFAMDNAVSIREASDHSVMRFEDNTEVKVYINEDHEITIFEA